MAQQRIIAKKTQNSNITNQTNVNNNNQTQHVANAHLQTTSPNNKLQRYQQQLQQLYVMMPIIYSRSVNLLQVILVRVLHLIIK